jgi:hypothetical protein
VEVEAVTAVAVAAQKLPARAHIGTGDKVAVVLVEPAELYGVAEELTLQQTRQTYKGKLCYIFKLKTGNHTTTR